MEKKAVVILYLGAESLCWWLIYRHHLIDFK
jgi:hypothetical protein